jgi:hypothetical protein
MFKVQAKQCDQCLLSPNRIVPARRVKQILKETLQKDCHFICHKTDDVACRGHFDATGGGQMARIAGRLGMIEFVEETGS